MTLEGPKNRVRVEDVGIPENYSILKDGITQGMLVDFATCRQKFLFRINGWRQAQEEGEALWMGSLIHHVLEKFYIYKGSLPVAFLERWIQEFVKKHPREDIEVALLKTRALMTVYFEYFANDRKKLTPVRTEEVFSVVHNGVRHRGRKDYVYRYPSKKLGMMEHKTKSRVDDKFLSLALAFDIQNCFYDHTEKLSHGETFSSIIYNIIRKSDMKPGAKESNKEFLKRMTEAVRKNPKDFFFRYEITLSPRDRKVFLQNLDAKLLDVKDYLDGKLRHYRNEGACQTPFRCNYLNACSSGFMTGYRQHKDLFPELAE